MDSPEDVIPPHPPTGPAGGGVPPGGPGAPPPPVGPDGNRRGAVLVAVIAAAALVVGLIVGALVFGGDDDGSTASPSTTSDGAASDDGTTSTTKKREATTTTASDNVPSGPVNTTGLDGDALELANAINNAYELSYNARYEGILQGQGRQTNVAIEVFRQPDETKFRRDTTLETSASTLYTRELRIDDDRYGCVSPDNTQWSCANGGGPVDANDPMLGTVDPSRGLVTVRDDDVEGVPARCFTISSAELEQDVCFDEAGIPILIDTPDGRLTRQKLEESVADNAFDLPGPIEGDITSTTGG